jgi:hypothetical protein
MTTQMGGWDDYINSFLSATNVESENSPFVCVGVSEALDENVKKIRLELEKAGTEERYTFELNKTNASFIKQTVSKPSAIVGKRIYFKKVEVISPKTKQPVTSLRISKVE